MSHTGYAINVYARRPLSATKVVEVAKALPTMQTLHVWLNHEDKKVAKGTLKHNIDIDHPSKKAVSQLLSDRDVSRALDTALFNYGRGELERGSVYVHLARRFSHVDSAVEIYGESDLADDLKRQKIQSWKQVASVSHESGEEGELDRRVFDYGKKVVKTIVTDEARDDYVLILQDFQDKSSIVGRDQFFESLDNLILQNCQGARPDKPALPAGVYVHCQVDQGSLSNLKASDIKTEKAIIQKASFGRHPAPGPFTPRAPLGLNLEIGYAPAGAAGATYTRMTQIESLMDDLKASTPQELVGKAVLAYLKGDTLLGLSKVKR